MIYELSIVAGSDLDDQAVQNLGDLVKEVCAQHEGEVLVEDDWGRLLMGQATSNGVEVARFLYFIFKANSENNVELLRRLKINESVLKSLVVKLGDESQAGEIVKNYKTPFSKKYNGSLTDEVEDKESGKDRRRFAKSRACWFTAKEIKADWKDPETYKWLVNEFGKISPARVSGISRKHQKISNDAIKRARQIGIISYQSNYIAERA